MRNNGLFAAGRSDVTSTTIEFNTIEPPFNPEGAIVDFICDTSSNPIGFRKSTGSLNTYNYDLRIFEERYNIKID